MLPDQEAGAADVVGIAEANQTPIAVGRSGRGARRLATAERRHFEHALADAGVPIRQLHPHRDARVAAEIAILDAPGHGVWGEPRRRLRGGAPL